nr:MAG TPA: hypothetical protein [Caudoviricetes sp.]
MHKSFQKKGNLSKAASLVNTVTLFLIFNLVCIVQCVRMRSM